MHRFTVECPKDRSDTQCGGEHLFRMAEPNRLHRYWAGDNEG